MFNWLKKNHNATSKFVLLQETHTDLDNEEAWYKDWGDRNILFAHGDSNSKGVAILLPSEIEHEILSTECDPDGRYIIINVVINMCNIWILNCYSPTAGHQTNQLIWLNKIQALIENINDSPIIIGGDLNDYFIPKLDKFNPKPNLPETDYINLWKAICNDSNLCDIWRTLNPDIKRYTWRQGKSKATLRQSRLDYWLISRHLIYNLNKVGIKPGFRSDHSLIDISFYAQETSNRGPSYWRFNSNLLKNIEYTDYINNRINEVVEKHKDIINPSLLWDTIKMELRSSTICFSKSQAIKNREHIKETIIRNSDLEKLMAHNPSEETINEYNATKLEIEYYHNEKANGAFVRSRADWAEFGEKNSKYFLNLEKRNYKMKCITKLITENDKEISDSNEILIEETDYYKKLYTQPTPTNNNERLQCLPEFLDQNTPKISEEEVELCDKPIDLEDIGSALKELQNGKAPGTDGFTPDFYKFFWIKIKNLVHNSLNNAYEQGELSIEQKRGVINLIPKKDKDIRYLKNWRPISLLNTDYKILTKTLAMRLKRVLPNIINDDQVAYLKDRFIGQNIRTIIDIMNYTKNNNKVGIIAFLDFEKAFDTIRWDVIEDTLKIFGLGENFIKWTKAIYNKSEACVTNNGFSSPFFKLSRGVRQGCPLSAYLFIMVVELLANKIRNSKDIKGIKIDNTEIKILQMADDTTIFVEDTASLKCVLKLISLFHMFAGLKLNKTKTEAMWLGKHRNCIEQPLGLKWVKEVHSLGIFFSYDTDYVIQKNFTDKSKIFKKVLDLWSQRDLSLIGKITILKSLAFSTLTYQCCSLTPPEDFIKTVNDMAFSFLWSKKPDKIKIKTIIADYLDGGLKMLDIETFIKAQKIMWIKRLCKPGDASWKAYPQYIFKKQLGINSFKCNLNINNIPKVDNFYWSILKNWTDIQEREEDTLTAIDIRRQVLWLNKAIIINKQEIKWNEWVNKNIFLIHDIIDNKGNFLTMNELNHMYGIKNDIMKYNSLKDAIPKKWRELLKDMDIPRDSIQANDELYIEINKQMIPLQMTNNKMIYWKMINEIKIPHVTKEKWEYELKIETWKWKNIFSIPMLIRDTKIRTFQYKLIMNLIPCNLYLNRIGKHDTHICNYCPEMDDTIHFFCDCLNTRQFWLTFQNWWNNMQDEHITLNKVTVLMGDSNKKINSNKNTDKLNACIQLARWYIYCEKLNLQEPFFYRFLTQLKY